VAVLCLFALPIVGLIRARKLELADIMKRGVAATGTITGITSYPLPKGGTGWAVTVEFRVPNRGEPVRVTWKTVSLLGSKPPKAIEHLAEGAAIAVHYLQKWPSLAVIDGLGLYSDP
jgi:hypothetical protein